MALSLLTCKDVKKGVNGITKVCGLAKVTGVSFHICEAQKWPYLPGVFGSFNGGRELKKGIKMYWAPIMTR